MKFIGKVLPTVKRIFIKYKTPFSYFIFFLFGYLLIHKSIEAFFNTAFVSPVFSEIEATWYNDIFFISCGIFVIIYSFIRQPFNTLNKGLTFLFIVIIYSVYRFKAFNAWDFISLRFYTNVYLFDILYILPIGQLSRWGYNKTKPKLEQKENKTNNSEELQSDSSLIDIKDDLFDFKRYVESLAEKLNIVPTDNNAFAISIHGEWGTGKTTFLSFLKQTLPDEKFIKVEIRPWDSKDSTKIIEDGLKKIFNSLRPNNPSLAKEIEKYYNKIKDINDSFINNTVLNLFSFLNEKNTPEDLKEDINNHLKSIDKKVVVFIDDLDRLDKKEIVEVLKLIRNTGSFSNTIYVVAFDRAYITSALKEINDYNPDKYLEKIFQLETTIPLYSKDILFKELNTQIEKYFPSVKEKDFAVKYAGDFENSLMEWLDNMRTVKRLMNNMLFYFGPLEREANYDEFIKLELLRIKHPNIYDQLFHQIENFTKEGLYNKNRSLNIDNFSRFLEDMGIVGKAKSMVTDLVRSLFTCHPDESEKRRAVSICLPDNFYTYFKHALSNGQISEKEFSETMAKQLLSIEEKIDKWITEEKSYSLKVRLSQISTFKNKEDFEKIIRVIMHFARISWGKGDNRPHSYSFDDLIRQIIFNKVRENTSFYSTEQEYTAFLRSLFKDNAKSPFYIESYVIKSIYDQYYNSHFPITSEGLKELLLYYLQSYCEETKKFDNYVLYLFSCCVLTQWERDLTFPNGLEISSPQEIVIEGAIEIVKKFIAEKDVDGFIIYIINYKGKGRYTFNFSNFKYIFSNVSDVKAFINEQDEERWKYLKEFKQFLSELESNEDQYGRINDIKFDFKTIDLTRR